MHFIKKILNFVGDLPTGGSQLSAIQADDKARSNIPWVSHVCR